MHQNKCVNSHILQISARLHFIISVYSFHIFLDVVDLGWQYEILRQVRPALTTLDSMVSISRVTSHKQTANL